MRGATDSEITEGPLHGVASARAVVSCVLVIGRRWLPLAAGVTLTVAVAGCLGLAAQANAYVYWTANGSTFGRANLNGAGADQRFIVGVSRPRMVAVTSRPCGLPTSRRDRFRLDPIHDRKIPSIQKESCSPPRHHLNAYFLTWSRSNSPRQPEPLSTSLNLSSQPA
jgi:hypothetical protein